jgi:hypothetical protein
MKEKHSEKIKIVKVEHTKKQNYSFVNSLFSRNIFLSLFLGIILAGLFSTVFYALAVWDGNPYAPGTQINPECAPTDANCTVTPGATYSFGTNNFSGSGNFTTTGTGSFSSLDLTLTALSVGNGGTGTGTIPTSGQLLIGKADGTYAVAGLTAGTNISITPGDGTITISAGSAAETDPIVKAINGIVKSNGTTIAAAEAGVDYQSPLPVLDSGKYLTNNGSTLSWGSIDLSGYVPTSTTVNGHALSGNISVTASDVGLGNVTNESKSTMFTSPTFTGTVSGITSTMVGLGNVENTALSTWTGSSSLYTVKLNGSTLSTSASGLKVSDSTFQPLAANLTSLAGLATTVGLVKQTSANTFGIDTTAYMSNPMDAIGQIIYGGASGVATKLAAGLSGQILISGGAGAPAWSTATYPSITTANQILYSTANNTIGASTGLTYNGAGSGTFTVGTGTEVLTVLSTGQVGIGNTAPTHALDIVSSTLTPQFNIYYDPTNYSSFDVDASGNLAVTSSGGNVTIGGTLTVGASNTAGTLATRYLNGAPTESDANGSLVIDSADGGRLYFRYGNTWHYIAQTAGFQIPDFETVDPISGDQIEEGDIVLGMINQTFDDGALHGIWVKWDSVKAQLLAEARGELSQTGTLGAGSVEGVETETLLDKVTNVLLSLGISVKDGVANITTLATQKFSADTATIKGLEMVDKATGDIYCTWIENGEWKKAKGNCGDIVAESSIVATSQISENQAKSSAQPSVSVDQITQQVAQQIAEQQGHVVEQVADQAARQASHQTAEQIQQQSQEQSIEIASVSDISDINVSSGSGLSDINLPDNIDVVLSDNSTQNLGITWDNGTPEYNGSVAGTYVFLGDLNLKTGVANAANLKATANVVVTGVEISPEDEQLPADAESQPLPEIISPSVGDLLESAGASLINGAWYFVEWIFGAFSKLINAFFAHKN